ncbi:MAG: type II secretion system protein [bacterium]
MNRPGHSGFTMIELLAVLLIIAVLACLAFPGIYAMMRASARNHTATRAQVLVNAIKAYRADYPVWPGQTQGDTDRTYDNSSDRQHSIVLDALTNNPRRKVYSEVAENITTNCYLDAWQRPYAIAIDENGDGVVNISATNNGATFSATNIGETVVIMSWGSDPSNSATRLYSWIR